MLPLILFAIAVVPMLAEAARSARNERQLRAFGASEPPGDVYAVMQVAYPACFVAMILEAIVRHTTLSAASAIGFAVFAASKALKYWSIATLGSRWTFRVLVPPRSQPIVAGPYRVIRHPNYAAVMGELTGMALMAQAPIAGALSMLIFGALIVRRIRVEDRALGRPRVESIS